MKYVAALMLVFVVGCAPNDVADGDLPPLPATPDGVEIEFRFVMASRTGIGDSLVIYRGIEPLQGPLFSEISKTAFNGAALALVSYRVIGYYIGDPRNEPIRSWKTWDNSGAVFEQARYHVPPEVLQ